MKNSSYAVVGTESAPAPFVEPGFVQQEPVAFPESSAAAAPHGVDGTGAADQLLSSHEQFVDTVKASWTGDFSPGKAKDSPARGSLLAYNSSVSPNRRSVNL